MDAETGKTILCKPPVCAGSVPFVGIVSTIREVVEDHSGRTQALHNSLRREVNSKLHSELSGGQRSSIFSFLIK